MTIYEKARAYMKFRNYCDYSTAIGIDPVTLYFTVYFAVDRYYFDSWEETIAFLARCYDDEVDAGNIKPSYIPPTMDDNHKFTDVEKRLFLSAINREEKVCKNIDKEFKDGLELVPIIRSIYWKVKRSELWEK